MSNGKDFADHLEIGINLLAIGAFVASERVAARQRLRREILQHNADVAAERAARARRRAAEAELGAELLAGWLQDRAQLH
jgi:hypothetical protein